MATVHVALLNVRSLNRGLPVADSVPAGGETLTSSGTSAAGTVAAANTDQVWSVSVLGGPVWIAFAAAPVAGPGAAGHMVQSGQTVTFLVTTRGEKIAIKDVL